MPSDSGPRWFHRSCSICEASCGIRVLADRDRLALQRVGHIGRHLLAERTCTLAERDHALLPLAGAIVAFPGVDGTQQQFTTASGRCTHQHAAAAIPLRR